MNEESIKIEKGEKFSYSKIGVFEQCKYKYKLIYRDKHFIPSDSVATEFGTLLHYIEEQMVKILTTTFKLNLEDYQNLIYLFQNADIHEGNENILGTEILKEKYKVEWNTPDKSGRTYEEKASYYITEGIYRLREFLRGNPNIEVLEAEKEFNFDYNGFIFHGFIDRVFRNVDTNEIYIEDIKTWSQPADDKDLVTPLQFVLYSLAAKEIYGVDEDKIKCFYDLPLCNLKQAAGTKGFIKRGCKKLDKLLAEIQEGGFEPSPSPLCHWCIFSHTYPDQPQEAKNLCPYFSHWTKLVKDFTVENEWMGEENHNRILEAFISGYKPKQPLIKPVIDIVDPARRFIIRR